MGLNGVGFCIIGIAPYQFQDVPPRQACISGIIEDAQQKPLFIGQADLLLTGHMEQFVVCRKQREGAQRDRRHIVFQMIVPSGQKIVKFVQNIAQTDRALRDLKDAGVSGGQEWGSPLGDQDAIR